MRTLVAIHRQGVVLRESGLNSSSRGDRMAARSMAAIGPLLPTGMSAFRAANGGIADA